MNLYITADSIGLETGGGKVTWQESQALASLGPCEVWGREQLAAVKSNWVRVPTEPWCWDEYALRTIQQNSVPNNYYGKLKLAHIYAGTFPQTVKELQDIGVQVCYTAAAHDIDLSRQEHEKLGIPYHYPHLYTHA